MKIAGAGRGTALAARAALVRSAYSAWITTLNGLEYETDRLAPPCWYPPMMPTISPRPERGLMSVRNGPPLDALQKPGQSNRNCAWPSAIIVPGLRMHIVTRPVREYASTNTDAGTGEL